ncbi:metabotropic glutamate receptor 4-like [Lineus longissimus]|uniref:metabotropic glutamate receptor 4-like n=1 Tax=Lineus longissimus TaxID=88925 RepID=UPI002B4D803B
MTLRALILVLFAFISPGCTLNPLVAELEGDVILGVVLPVHQRTGISNCGRISSHGIQAMQAISDALHEINSRTDFPPIVIGAVFLDTCNVPLRAASLVMSHFQPDGVLGNLANVLKIRCPSGQHPNIQAVSVLQKVVGVISGARSFENHRLATISGLLGIPVVSYRSSYRQVPLGDIARLVGNEVPFLTSSPDFPLDESPPICELLRRLESNYVSLVTGEDYASYMISKGMETCLRRNRICIAARLMMKEESSPLEYEQILDGLNSHPSAKYVIVIDGRGSKNVRGLFAAARRRGLTGRFRWLDGSGWGADGSFDVTGLEDVILGAITVQPRPIEDFRLKESHSSQPSVFAEYLKPNITEGFINPELIYAREAVYAYAYALMGMYRELCPGRPAVGLCSRMWPSNGTVHQGSHLYKKLKEVRFSEGAGQPFYFNSRNEGRKNLLLKQYTKVDGRYSWQQIGTYEDTADLETRLTIQPSASQALESLTPSVCSLPCQSHERKSYMTSPGCCWICVNGD